MRLDSPFVLTVAGTLAIHVLFAIAADAVVVMYPYQPPPPAPRIDLVDVEVPPPPEPPKPPPPPVAKPVEEPKVQEQPKTTQKRVVPRNEPPPDETQETVPIQESIDPGGSEVVQMEDIAPSAKGVAVKVGKRNTGAVGRGGNGGGTGGGSGAGSADIPPPVSVATIKSRAMPKGDYAYFNTGNDYPAAAKQLGIEGPIRVRLVVDDKGKVKSAVLLNKLGHGLDELALSRARQIEFEPAKDTDDRAVTSVVVWTFHMTLPK